MQFMSMYFYGFACGIILFPLPDKLGKKATMTWLMIPFVLASALAVFGTTIEEKSVGLFLQGFLHLKIMVSYAHMFELTDESNKPFCSLCINTFDISSVSTQGLAFFFLTRDATSYMEFMWYLGTAATFLYLLVVPESPRWLFLQHRHSEAINNLNYIAWLNGSSKRIPISAQFDFLEQAII